MGKLNQPGYPLPSGELGEDEIVCQLVYLPDRPEYWQALVSALHYFSTWRAWERDDDKRGKDAASNWREAFELTIGCWRMTCLEQLQSDVSDILAHLRNSDKCCSENITYYDSSTYITIIIPGDGAAPATYGETEVEDWDEWLEYLCYNSNLWVDELIRAAGTVEVALNTGGLSIGVLAALIAAIAFFVVGGVVALPLLMTVLFGLSVDLSSVIFSDAADDLEDAREDIVCAILNGTDVAAVIEAALSSGTAWDTLYSFLDYDSAVAILYEGGDGETYLEDEKSDTCSCDPADFYELRIDGDGTWESLDHVNSEDVAGCDRANIIRCYRKFDNVHFPMTVLGMSQITPVTCNAKNLYRLYDYGVIPEEEIWDSDTAPSGIEHVGSITVQRSIPFTNVEINWEPYFE